MIESDTSQVFDVINSLSPECDGTWSIRRSWMSNHPFSSMDQVVMVYKKAMNFSILCGLTTWMLNEVQTNQ